MAKAIGRKGRVLRRRAGGAEWRRVGGRGGSSARLTAVVAASCLAFAGIQASVQFVGAGPSSAAGPANGQIAVTAGDTGNGLATGVGQMPYGLAVAPGGQIYVSDQADGNANSNSPLPGYGTGDSVIRLLDPSTGDEQVVAGDGVTSSVSGVHDNYNVAPVDGALYRPAGIAVDPTNNSLVFDEPWLGVTDRYTPAAGANPAKLSHVGSHGAAPGVGDAAVDNYGNVIVPEFSGSDLKVFAQDTGTFWGVSMTAGDTYTINLGRDDPWAVTVDKNNNLIVSVSGDDIEVIPNSSGPMYGTSATVGVAFSIAGTPPFGGYGGDGGPATSALVDSPHGLSVDKYGNIIVADTFNERIRMIAESTTPVYGIAAPVVGDIYTIAGAGGLGSFSGDGGPATTADLNNPTAAVADQQGNLVIADEDNFRVRVVAESTSPAYGISNPVVGDIYTVAGNGWSQYSGDGAAPSAAQLAGPTDISYDSSGNELIADTANDRVRVVAATSGTFYGVAMTEGDIYTVAGPGSGFDVLGDGGPATSAVLNNPAGVRSDAQGNLLIADTGDNCIRFVAGTTSAVYGISSPTVGDIYTLAGTCFTAGSGGDNGPATSAELRAPQGVMVDQYGNVVIADTGNNRVRVVAKATGTYYGISMQAGNIYTIAGTGTGGYNGDAANATTAELDAPIGLALDPAGNVVVADSANGRVRVIGAAAGSDFGQTISLGGITTVMGGGSDGTQSEGVAPTSVVLTPERVATDSAGDLIVSDDAQDRLRVLAGRSGTLWGQVMTTGSEYVVAGGLQGGFTPCAQFKSSGPATSAYLCSPNGVAVDPSGNIDVASPELDRVFAIGNDLEVTTTSLPDGYAGTSYSQGLTAVGGSNPFTWIVTAGSLPPGLMLTTSGTISGTPQAGGTYSFTVQATDSDTPTQSVTQPLSITVHGLEVTTTSLPEGFVNVAYDAPPLAAQYGFTPETWSKSAGTLPPGVTLNSDGSFSGTPTAMGTYSFTAQVTDADPGGAQAATQVLSILVEPYATSSINTAVGVQSAGGSTATTTAGSSPTSTAVGQPYAVTVDSYGNTIFTDASNSEVDVLAGTTGTFYGIPMTAGQVYLLAGGGSSSTLGTPAATFGLSFPDGLTIDKAGNLVIADGGLDQVFVVANSTGPDFGQPMTAGDIYAVAGSGSYGFSGSGGPATSAEFEYPSGVAVDAAGNLLVADALDNTVWVVAATTGTFYGTDLTTAGDIYSIVDSSGAPGDSGDGGAASAATLNFPLDVAVDAAGNVVIADWSNNAIRVVANTPNSQYGTSMAAGDIYTIAGTGPSDAGFGGDGGPAASAELNGPQGVGFDSRGDLYIADSANNRIRMIPASSATYFGIPMTAGDMYTVAGDGTPGYSGDGGPSGLAELDAPTATAFTPDGTLVIADYSNFVLRTVAGGLPVGGTPPTVTAVNPTNGPQAGGNTVTVTGTGFVSGSTTVDFGSTAGTSVNVSNSSSLTVVVPAGTGTVSVQVTTTSGGTSTPLVNAYTYNASNTPGGAITLTKTTALIGNYSEKVSGTGWTADTTVTLHECATTTYSASTCDTANQAGATLGTGTKAGTFKNAVITLAVGTIDTDNDTCGLSGSPNCYVVVTGNSGDATASGALGFTLPSFTAKKTTAVLGNYADGVSASGIPIGDHVSAEECDNSVVVPTTVSSNCDNATLITGTAGTNGKVVFTSPGVPMRVDGAYAESASGTCLTGGTCKIGVVDTSDAAISASLGVAFATPTITVHKTTGVLGNYVNSVKAAGFPIGDMVTAQECDSSTLVPPAAANCDASTAISGTVAANGKVVFPSTPPLGVTMLVGGDFTESGSGTCVASGTCQVVVDDTSNPTVGLEQSVAFAAPAVSVHETTNVAANYVDKVTAANFPVGDTVTAQECDTAVTVSTIASHCDSSTEITGTVASNGKVTWPTSPPLGVTIHQGGAFSDIAGGSCPPGGTCDVVVNDSNDSGFYVVTSVGLAS